MRKRTLLVILVSLLFAGIAFAVPSPTLEMVDGNNSTTAQPHGGPSGYASYGWTQQPWLWVQLPSNAFHYTVSWWNHIDAGDPVYYWTYEWSAGVTDVWHSLSNWFTVRQEGDWQVKLDYSTSTINDNSTITNFSITPEPVSSALFLAGGLGLAVLQLVKRRKVS